MTREKVLVTGSAGHLGDALARVLRGHGYEVVGLDLLASPSTTVVGSITERALVRDCLSGVSAVLHTATLSTRGPAPTWTGPRATTSAGCWTGCGRARSRAAC